MHINPTNPPTEHNDKKSMALFALSALFSLFFIWGFITALNDILLPFLKAAFDLSYLEAGLVQFCFFIAYFVVSPFAGRLLDDIGYKKGIIVGLLTIAAGCCLFYPAAALEIYALFLFALFVLASGIAFLQVSANPYVAVLGPEKTAASRLNLAQATNSVGHTIGPYFGATLILANMSEQGENAATAVQMPYILIAVFAIVIALVFSRLKLPNIGEHLKQVESSGALTIKSHPHLTFGVVGIFLYVGAEVAVGSYLVNYFMQMDGIEMDNVTAGKMVSYYWLSAMAGRFIGAALTRYISATYVLAFNSVFAIIMIVFSINTTGNTAIWSILLVGLFNSIMFPTIFALAIRGLGEHTGKGSGFLCQAIVGGAIVPMLQGFAADAISLKLSFIVPAACYGYILWYALKGANYSQADTRGDA
ncbi:sugar MFS transporter [Agaribacter marinus]|uniref:MFS transporter n=1 Tax=Agaribacter marinus TaxID=1431249 RepID=A0AA37SVP8_9ALTE|nr:sugar MFS transporter [Agaribacter marinus]GLR70408.1 MFS transporter [Agaribacter marinus]